MDFTAPEETALNLARYRFEGSTMLSNQDFHSKTFFLLDDDDEEDNKISMMMSIMSKESLMNQDVSFDFANLQGSDSSTSPFYTVISGEWKTSLRLSFKDYSTEFQVDQDITMFGYPATVNTVSISPISVTLQITSPHLPEIDQAGRAWSQLEQNKDLDRYPVTINYQDGTCESTSEFNTMTLSEYDQNEMLTIRPFEAVINDNEITSILFCGTELTIAD